jgi:hypothetical protein
MNISLQKVKSLPDKENLFFPEWVARLRLRRFLNQSEAPPQHAHRWLERLLDEDLSLHGKSRSVPGDASHPDAVERTTALERRFLRNHHRI